jgi:3-hydroxyacyl-[acyl-carrier-protein] dehydratase
VLLNEVHSALQLLPHGPEFRFLTRVTALEPGKSGRAEYDLRGDEPFLRGHFPGSPLMPGVLLVEAAAQLAGVVAQSDPALKPLANLKLAAIRNAKILGSARPGATIILEATIAGRFDHLVQVNASAISNGERILETTLTLSGDRPA